MEREKLGSRLGFILVSAGCAIGLGNVWRFPYIVAQYGGAAFILIYLLFLLIFGLPIMTMEFSVGRASQKSIADSFTVLERKGTKWHIFSWAGIAGNYLLMMFYTTVSGWMFAYFYKMLAGDFEGHSKKEIVSQFGDLTADPWLMFGLMVLVTVIGFLICSLGLKNGVEKITKVMMLALLVIISLLAIRAVTLPGALDGVKYYLVPNFETVKDNFGEVIFAAMGQAFFTLSIGMGSMAVFGSYMKKDRSLLGETMIIAGLDTFVALIAGLIIIPSCFAFGYTDFSGGDFQGPGLIFKILPEVFNSLPASRIIGSFFFLFMIFAALSTVIAVFENIISFGMDKWGWSRKKSCIINFFALVILSVPCILGFNVLSGFHPLGGNSNIQDLEDFFISNNIQPLGSLVYVLFCTSDKFGWGWKNFKNEANLGKGPKVGDYLRFYCKYILPLLLLFVWIQGYISKFFG